MLENIPLVMYLAETVDHVGAMAAITAVLSFVTAVIMFVLWMATRQEYMKFAEQHSQVTMGTLRRGAKASTAIFVVSLLVAMFIPSAKVLHVYLGTQVAKEIVESEAISTEVRDIYTDIKAIIHGYATGPGATGAETGE